MGGSGWMTTFSVPPRLISSAARALRDVTALTSAADVNKAAFVICLRENSFITDRMSLVNNCAQ
jgi:hypothetical protein